MVVTSPEEAYWQYKLYRQEGREFPAGRTVAVLHQNFTPADYESIDPDIQFFVPIKDMNDIGWKSRVYWLSKVVCFCGYWP